MGKGSGYEFANLLILKPPKQAAFYLIKCSAKFIERKARMTGLPVSDEKHVYDNILGAIGQTPLVRLARNGIFQKLDVLV